MIRWLVLLPPGGTFLMWAVAGLALLVGDPLGIVCGRIDAAVGATVGVYLVAAGWLGWTRLAPLPTAGPAWALIQAEKHRRKGRVFAGWGIVISASWLLVRPGPVAPGNPSGGLVGLVVAMNLGFQPGIMVAETLAVVARVKLGQMLIAGPV